MQKKQANFSSSCCWGVPICVFLLLSPRTISSYALGNPALRCKHDVPSINDLSDQTATICHHLLEFSSKTIRSNNRSVLFHNTKGNAGSERISLNLASSNESGPEAIPKQTQTYESVFPDLTATAALLSPEQIDLTSDRKVTDKFFNYCLLIACFGFAAYSIFNVDEGMTRGWSVAEKAMRIPLDNWSSYEASLNSQPVITKTVINVIIYSLGDWLSQTLFVGEDILEFDARRTLRNGFIGLCFGPLVHQYYEFSDSILPVEVGFNRLYKILMDQTLYISVKCSIYIVAVNLLSGESLEYAIENVRTKIKDVMFTAWKFWPLVHCVTYGVIPARHRILWVNCIDLIWNAILAQKTSNDGGETLVEGDEAENLVVADGAVVGVDILETTFTDDGQSPMQLSNIALDTSLSIMDSNAISNTVSTINSDNNKMPVANATEN